MSVRPEFGVHRLNDLGLEAADELARGYTALLDLIDRLVPAGCREKSVAIIDLQNSCFWAKRAIAIQPDKQHVDPSARPHQP